MGRKRKNGEGTVRLRKDGRWEGRVVIGYDEKGLSKTKNVLAKTKGECVEKLKALKNTITPPTAAKVKADMSFGDWLDLWYENYSKPAVRPSTQRIYEGYIRLYIRPRLGRIPLNKLTANDLQQLFTWMKTDGGAESGLADSQVVNCHSLCHRALEKAVADRLIARNPADGCKLPALKREEMKILSREAMQRLLIQAKEENYYELFLLEFATGLRLGELMGLQWDDLDLTTGELRVKVESRWLFPSPKKEDLPLRPSVVHHRLHRLLYHAGCERIRFHDLRHTFATNALAHGMDVKTLSNTLGHYSARFILDTYTHATQRMRRVAADTIGFVIDQAM